MSFTVGMDRHEDRGSRAAGGLRVVGTGRRRRRWSEAEKRRIVEESLAGPQEASATARRHGIATSLLYKWRQALLGPPVAPATPDTPAGPKAPEAAAPAFVPVTVIPEALVSPPQPAWLPSPAEAGRLEIVLTNGRRLIVGAGTDAGWLAQILRVVERP
jgi:transposase